MMAAVRDTVLRVSSASMAQHSPAQLTVLSRSVSSGSGAPSGQCTSPSGRCSRSGTRLPIRARSRRSLRQYPPAAA